MNANRVRRRSGVSWKWNRIVSAGLSLAVLALSQNAPPIAAQAPPVAVAGDSLRDEVAELKAAFREMRGELAASLLESEALRKEIRTLRDELGVVLAKSPVSDAARAV